MLSTVFAATAATAAIAAPVSDIPADCHDPVYLVVVIDHLDRTKSKGYGEALRKTQIVRRHGGAYRAVGAPDAMLEGDWPTDRNLVIEEYPCAAVVKSMWSSEEYQHRIKPLRAGSGSYTVGIFKQYQAPAPVGAK